MIREEDTIIVGKFQKTHALKGELNAILDVDPEYFLEGNSLIIRDEGILVPFFAESVRSKGKTSYLIKLNGIDSEAKARQFVNQEIRMLKSDSEEWLDEDILEEEGGLLGYSVIDDENGIEIGKIIHIDQSTDNILFIVENGGEEIFIPASEDFIISIDDEAGSIRMRLPEGLVDINRKAGQKNSD